MEIKISGRNIDIGDSLKEYTEKQIENIVEKYLYEDISSTVSIIKENKLFNVEICLYLFKGFIIKTNGSSDDPYHAVMIAIERLEERIKKHKNRIRDKKHRVDWEKAFEATRYTIERKESQNDADEEHLVIAEQASYVLPMSVSEAVMKLDLTELPVVMFRNADTDRINVVYKRSDGHIGWIDYKN